MSSASPIDRNFNSNEPNISMISAHISKLIQSSKDTSQNLRVSVIISIATFALGTLSYMLSFPFVITATLALISTVYSIAALIHAIYTLRLNKELKDIKTRLESLL